MNKNESILSPTTRKQLDEYMNNNKASTLTEKQLLMEIVNQLKELNMNISSYHEEVWEANQRRADDY